MSYLYRLTACIKSFSCFSGDGKYDCSRRGRKLGSFVQAGGNGWPCFRVCVLVEPGVAISCGEFKRSSPYLCIYHDSPGLCEYEVVDVCVRFSVLVYEINVVNDGVCVVESCLKFFCGSFFCKCSENPGNFVSFKGAVFDFFSLL